MIARTRTLGLIVVTLSSILNGCSSSDPAPGNSAGAPSAGSAGADTAHAGQSNGGSGNTAGAAGSSMNSGGGSSSAGASAAGGASGAAGASAGAAGSAGASAGAAGSAGASGMACPSGAIFCADFEEASGLPMGATLQAPDETGGGATFETLMKLDTMAPYAGKQSLAVSSPGVFHYRMVGVTVPSAFWVRLFIKSDQAIGQPEHNSFFQAMTDPNYHNSKTSLELSEQYSCLVLNEHDALFPKETTCAANTALSKDTWHCMEANFDGVNGNVQIYADKVKIIDAMSWMSAKADFNTFEFGYANYHSPGATVWYDNVAIATSRIGCP